MVGPRGGGKYGTQLTQEKRRRKEVRRFASLPEATSHSFFSFWSEVACDTVIKLWVLVQVPNMVIDSTESGATAVDNCERAFGLIRASWATRNNHRHADDQASFLETFERSVSRFESEYTATVIYDDDGAVRYSFGEPQQPAAVEEI